MLETQDDGAAWCTTSLIPGSVPELKSNRAVLEVHGLAEKVDADRSLIRAIERVVHEPRNDTGLANRLQREPGRTVRSQRGENEREGQDGEDGTAAAAAVVDVDVRVRARWHVAYLIAQEHQLVLCKRVHRVVRGATRG